MAIEVDERDGSPRISGLYGPNARVELLYYVLGTDNEHLARAAVQALSPGTYDPYNTGITFFPRGEISLEKQDGLLWDFIVNYSAAPVVGQSSYQFDIGGTTQHITHSLQTMGRYAPAGQIAPDFKGAIGVTPNGIEGVDIEVESFDFSETHILPAATVTPTWIANAKLCAKKVNSVTYKGYPAGEIRFRGVGGSKRGDGDWEMTFGYSQISNRVNIQIGDITVASKDGWDYLWVLYEDVEDTSAKRLTRRPIGAYVERVIQRVDLNILGV